ncbi:benzoate/H(+) symporter BenE family transporter [Massilia niastensis]|uniref:benzoate/H(+) symporter BenE family transporter n=1 Tax=Massilia niastensis TaxID=544911 RepID=UPI0003631AE8
MRHEHRPQPGDSASGADTPRVLPPMARTAGSDWSASAVTAGFLAVLVSFTGPLAIFYQAAQAAQAAQVDNAMFASWVWGISIGAALSGIVLSWWLRVPVITAWSAPGTALLITLFPELSLHEAVGAYITAAAVLLAIGLSGSFDRVMGLVPKGVASGMMAGILLPFGLEAFKSTGTLPLLAFGMIGAYLVFKRAVPRYSVMLLLVAGVLIAVFTGATRFSGVALELVTPQFITPAWSWASTFSLALPLVLVTLTGQYLPGMAVLKTSGYIGAGVRPIMSVNSIVSLAVAVTGGITIAIAAITAAMCTGRDAHEDPRRRYVAGIANGLFYLAAGLCGGSIVMLFSALPRELVVTLAGLALLGPITANLAGVIAAEDHREASIITFLATASGMSFLGLGAAFWGIVIGMAACWVLHGSSLKGGRNDKT